MVTIPVKHGVSGWLNRALAAPVAAKIYWLLRIGLVWEFIGHGLAGWSKSPAWLSYFALFGFSEQFSIDHMYYVTAGIDTAAGLIMLIRPTRVVLWYMTVWGTFTAFLRPASGESWYEVLERGGNYGMPLAMLLLVGWTGFSVRRMLERVDPPATLNRDLAGVLDMVMRFSIALLLIGHGGFGLQVRKAEWYDYFEFFGVSAATVDSAHLMSVFGAFEMLLGVAIIVKPWRILLIFILVWKLLTELLRPLTGQAMFQFIERGGDYFLPAAHYLLIGAGLGVGGYILQARRSRASNAESVRQPD